MEIKSNTLGKLKKIKEGSIFTDEFVYLKEFIQNTQRSQASCCNITLDNDKLIFEDNGCGCKNPESLFTLDLSDWKSTNEGFGIGFWSCLCIPKLEEIVVESKNWKGHIDVDKLFSTGDLSVDLSQEEPREGFRVTLISSELQNYKYEVGAYLEENTKYIDDIIFSFNGEMLAKKDLFDLQVENAIRFDNLRFEGTLYPSAEYGNKLDIYYEKRKVITLQYDFPYTGGIVNIKKGMIQLKEPDRTSFVWNKQYKLFGSKMRNCIITMYKEFISNSGEQTFNSMDNAITFWLKPKDYEKYLKLDFVTFVEEDEISNISSEENNNEISEPRKQIKRELFFSPDTVTRNPMNIAASYSPSNSHAETAIEYNSFNENKKKVKKSFWVKSNEVEDYEDSIAKAKYCGLNVIIARNKLYECVLEEKNILHISTLMEHLSETFRKYDVLIKNNKEENFILLLEPIRKKFNLPDDCFFICNIEKENALVVNDKTIWKEVIANKKDDIKIYGCCDSRHIYLDRRALKLHKWNIKNTVGINELKALMNCANTIAHELSHYLYHTVDNTVEHFQNELQLQEEIIKLYL